MNPDQLIAHFDRISEAPDAIPRLRHFILDLAVRGKLVQQDPNDEPATTLLDRICVRKARLLEEGTLRKERAFDRVTEEDAPFEIPANWKWARIGSCALLTDYGTSVKSEANGEGIPVLKMGDIQNGRVILGGQKTVPHDIEDLPQLLLKSSDLLYNRTNSAELVGKTGIYLGDDGAYTFASYLIRIRFINDLTNPSYVNVAMNAPFFRKTQIVPELQQQCGQANVNGFKLRKMLLPLPPHAEQARIVAKVDELMTLCDRLELSNTERERRRNTFVAASLKQLNNGADPRSFGEHARFYFNHLPRLTVSIEHIKRLRQTILALAVKGNLVPQDPKDEPASDLLNPVRLNSPRRRNDSLGSSPGSQFAIDGNTMPFPLPIGWEWVRFGDVITSADSGWSPKSESFPRSGANWGVIKVSAVSWNQFLPEENKQLLPEVSPPERCQIHAGDFLISRANTSELVAKSVVVQREPQKLILSDKIVRLQMSERCDKHFICLVNNHAGHARSYYVERPSGTSLSMKNVSRDVIYGLAIPLPPLAEQRRIVAKVDELMAVCDELEAHIINTQVMNRDLLDSVLHNTFEPVYNLTADSRGTE